MRPCGLQQAGAAHHLIRVIQANDICRVKLVEFVDLAPVFDRNFLAHTILKNALPEFVHVVKYRTKPVFIQSIYYQYHFRLPR